MSKTITAEQFYNDHIAQEKEFIQISVARPVKADEIITIATDLGLDAQISAPENGYEISSYIDFRDSIKEFITEKDFAKKYEVVENVNEVAEKEDLPADAKVTFVKKGAEVQIDTGFGIPAIVNAPYDGAHLSLNGGKNNIYLSNFQISSVFNVASKKENTHKEYLVAHKDDKTIKGIVLDQDTTLAFKAGDYTAEAGSFIAPNPKDEDGYTVYPEGFVALALRTENTSKPALKGPKNK